MSRNLNGHNNAAFVNDNDKAIQAGDKPRFSLELTEKGKISLDDDYNPYEQRTVEHPTTNSETMFHLLKGSLGTGILAMPNAFRNAGYATGTIGTLVIGAICTYCIHQLIKAEYELCRRKKTPSMNYPSVAEAGFGEGPAFFKKMVPYIGHTVNVFLLIYQLGTCCVYVVFVSSNIKSVVDAFVTEPLDVRMYMVFVLLPLILINWVRNLKYLAPLSTIANAITMVSFGIICYYIFREPVITEGKDAFASYTTFPLFFGTVLFALEAIGVVTEGSLAEEAGLKLDDVIVRINDEATSPMSHDEAHRVISSCGNVFFLGVQREEEETETQKFFPIIGNLDPIRSLTPDSMIDTSIQSQIDELSKSPASAIADEEEIKSILGDEPPAEIVDQEIADLLSEEAEVLDEPTVIGVNVNRVFPKPGVCNSSEVLRELKAEAIKTKQEKELDKKKWTTFMQKPNRPIPKSKAQLEAEARAANAYKVKIVKNYKKPEPVRPPTPIPESEPEVIEPPKAETPPPEIEEEPPTDTEVPNLEPLDGAIVSEDQLETDKPEETEIKVDEVDNIRDVSVAKEERVIESVDREGKSPSESSSQREKTEEELQLEQQLASVQQQLLALANLPSTIQSTLDAVTRQLSELLPTFKLQTRIAKEATPEIIEEVKQEEVKEVTATDESKETTIIEKEVVEVDEKSVETIETEIRQSYHEETSVKIETETKQEVTVQEYESSHHRNYEEEQMEEEQNMKRKKENGVIEELQKQMQHKETQKRKKSKRMFGPLVPQERPLVLPGGRRWYRPKDAYNDEFIAETLTAQAELIAGTAVGHKFESPLLGYDERENNCGSVATQLEKRVNFMKYQKPEKKVDLDKSEVYKILHHLDRSPIRGIEVRPPVVVAEADVRRAVES